MASVILNSEQKSQTKQFNIDFNVVYNDAGQEEIESTKTAFLSLNPAFDIQEADQISLWRLLTVGRLNNIPIFQLLYSCYMRDRFNFYMNKQNGLKYSEFVNRSPTIKRILKSHNNNVCAKIISDIIESLKLFFVRRCNEICLPALNCINDDINTYAEIIIETIKFINQSLNNQDKPNSSVKVSPKLPPFQIDLWIIPNNVEPLNEIESEDEDDDDINETKVPYSVHSSLDNVGDIEKRLNDLSDAQVLKLPSFRPSTGQFQRSFDRKFSLMKKRINNTESGNKDLVYPHKERVCIIIDRRNINVSNNSEEKKESENSKKNSFFIFKPKEYHSVPTASDFMSEWFIEASCAHILPSLNDESDNSNINAQEGYKGFMFLLSFQIEEEKIQKCWLYNRSMIHRFLPKDIIDLLPLLFKEGSNVLSNDIKQQVLKGIQKGGVLEWNDSRFDEFYIPIDVKKKDARHENDVP